MYSKMASIITNFLVKNKSVDMEYYEIYLFGTENLIADFFGKLFLVIVSFVIGAQMEAIIFYFVFKHMRIYSGGYHAKTYTKCNISYLLTFCITVCVIRFFEIHLVMNLCNIFALISTLLLSPIENINNPIPQKKYNSYFRYSIYTIIILLLFQFILYYIRVNLSELVAVTMLMSAIFMWIEVIRRRITMVSVKKRISDFIAKKATKSALRTIDSVSMNKMYQPPMPKGIEQFKEK